MPALLHQPCYRSRLLQAFDRVWLSRLPSTEQQLQEHPLGFELVFGHGLRVHLKGRLQVLLRSQIERSVRHLGQQVEAFSRQLADLMEVAVLNQQGQFTFFRRLLNYDGWRIAGRPQSTQFLDYQVVNSDIEAKRDHLRVGDHIIRVLTMKEVITETRPLALDALLKIPGNFHVVTEWTPTLADKARKEVNKRRRHFNVSKTGFVSQMGNDVTKTNPRDVLVDESKQADIENLGDCLRCLGDGQSLGDSSIAMTMDTYGTTFDAELTAASSKVAERVFSESRKSAKSPHVRGLKTEATATEDQGDTRMRASG